MELDEDFLKAPMGERPPLPGDKEEGQECRAFHPSAVKAFKIQTRLNATTIAQEEAKKADQVAAVERSAAVLHELQGGPIDGGGDGGQLLKNLDLDLFRENCWISWARTGGGPHRSSSRPRPLRRRRRRSTRPDKRRAPLRPECSSPSSLHSVRGLTRSELPLRQGSLNRSQHGGTSAWTTSRPSRTLTSKPRRSSRWVGTPFRRPSKAGGAIAARPGAEGPDRRPTIPPASGSGATSSGAEGPDRPSATPGGLDTQDPEVQLAVLRWMMSKRVGEVRIFAGRWVRRPGPVHVPDWANNLTKVNPEALEKGTHPRNHQAGGLPWARYSIEELNQQAKAGDRPYPQNLRSPHDPDDDFHWARQISSWTLPGLLGMFGHSFTLRQLWGVWESLPLLQGSRQRGPKNKAQNQIRLEGWETLKKEARCFLKEEGLPLPQTGPEWRLVYRAMGQVLAARAFLTDTPAEVMQLPVQDVADSKQQMILRAVCDERISVPLESLIQFPEVYKALMDRIGGPGALAEVKVNWRCNTKQWWVGAVPDAVAPSIYRKLGYTDDMIKLMGLDPSAPGCRTGADGPDIRPRGGEGDEGIVYPPITSDNVHGVVGKEYRKKNFSAETKHAFWAHMECGLVLSSVTPWELIPKTKGETRGGYMCKYCKGYWRAGGGGTRLLQIRAGKAILQLVLDEPPDGLYNRWVKERLEFYRRVEPSAPLRDVSVVDQKVPRFRFGHTTQTGHVSDAIWELILRNPEAAALKRIDDIAKGAA